MGPTDWLDQIEVTIIRKWFEDSRIRGFKGFTSLPFT